jgi:hypothetical protein
MQRRTVGVLIAGWLLGLLTAFVAPSLTVERQTVFVTNAAAINRVRELTAAGWTVSRSDVAMDDARLITFERPRYVGLSELASSWASGPAHAPTPALPKPTEAPKPAAPAASPRVP